MRGPRQWNDHDSDCICPRCRNRRAERSGAEALRRRLQPDSEEPAAHSQPAGRKFLVWTAVIAAVGLLSVCLAIAFVIEPTRTEVREFFGFSQPPVPTPSGPLPFQALAQTRHTPAPTTNYSIDDVDISLMPTETGATLELTVTVQNTSGSAISAPMDILLSIDGATPEVAATILELDDGASDVYVFSHDLLSGRHILTVAVGDARRDLTVEAMAIPVPDWQVAAAGTVESTKTPEPTVTVQQVVATPVPESTETAEPTVSPTPAWIPTPVVPPTPEPTATPVPPTPTVTPVPPTPTVAPTVTPIPVISLAVDVETSVVGYWSDGTADVTLHVTLNNEGSLEHEGAQEVQLSCIHEDCEELSVNLTLADGYGPALGSFTLRLPMGDQTAVELDYGADESVTLDIEVPERILGVERDLFECYADRPPEPVKILNEYFYGCGGWGTAKVEKWLNDVPVKVWTTGDPLYIEHFRTVLDDLSPIMDLEFVWVETEAEADLKGYIGVQREDIDQLGFQPKTVDYGGFANASTVSGEATSGYIVVWYIGEAPPVNITVHETLHALVPINHSTRPTSVMGGSGLDLLSPRDKALIRFNSHPLVRPGMTMQQVENLIVFRDELMGELTSEPVTDPVQMLWRTLVSFDEAGSAGYNLIGGWTDRQCNRTFGVRRGPLQFKIGRFRLWRDDPALLYFHDHVNEIYTHFSETDRQWKHHTRPLSGSDWRFITYDEFDDLTNWWNHNGKLHRAIRSVLQDAMLEDVTVEKTDDDRISLHVLMDHSYTHFDFWNWEAWGFKELDFSLTLSPETFAIEGYRWVMHRDPDALPGDPCLTYEEVATDFELGVEIKRPDEIPE